ncbi:hypothetical protein [Peribacillus sp. NJ4]|uniref:hypothetical protein n=1 Tax=Peribacillus sp. NJ4 TaxID=3055862 RepID=UPI0025A23C11|nr:hypothetical protein [Peribacillus sp. NJ4]
MLIGIYGLEKHMIIILKELMEFVVGLLSFVGEVISAWAIAAWSYSQENLTTI